MQVSQVWQTKRTLNYCNFDNCGNTSIAEIRDPRSLHCNWYKFNKRFAFFHRKFLFEVLFNPPGKATERRLKTSLPRPSSFLRVRYSTRMKLSLDINNRPFYSCVLKCQAFDLEWGWRWPCCDKDQYLVS